MVKIKSEAVLTPKILSDKRISKANYEFDVFEDFWKLNASFGLNFKTLSSFNLNKKFSDNFRLLLADYACEFSSGYVDNIYLFCRDLFSFGVVNNIKEENVINFKASLTDKTEYKLGFIRAFLIAWHEKGLSGVDKKVVLLLESMKIKGNQKGKAVTTGCPHSGAYSFEEQVAFINWYVNSFTQKIISLEEYAFIMGLQRTGARPIQLSYLYYGDLVVRKQGSIEHYDINLPNAKKRNEGIRESFQYKKDVSEDLMLVFVAQAEQSIKKIQQYFSIKLTDNDKKIIPVFLREEELKGLSNFDAFLTLSKSNPDFFCIRDYEINNMMKRLAKVCQLKTSRIIVNGEPGDLHISPRRFRYTHATNMAINGASVFAIAEELGHSDTQNVKVYTEFKEEIADRIDTALESSLIPMAQAFTGMLVDSQKDAIRANDPRSFINNDNGNSVGNCGKFGFCGNGTIHCYTCNKFQPWVYAPHKEVLASVLSELELKRQMGASEFVLHSHNRSIDAIKVVIMKCDARKEELINIGALDV
ncbi:MAG: site-specific integrase [Paraglaciecola sp.]|nr:site-specific integrase [Paraglaciecola sp.]